MLLASGVGMLLQPIATVPPYHDGHMMVWAGAAPDCRASFTSPASSGMWSASVNVLLVCGGWILLASLR